MTWLRRLTTASTASLLAYACGLPPPDHTLPVRNPNKACYFALGDCHLYRNAAHGGEDENDAGADPG